MLKYKDIEVVHGENEKNLALAINKKFEEGYVLVGEMQIKDKVIAKTNIGFEVRVRDFFQYMAKVVSEE